MNREPIVDAIGHSRRAAARLQQGEAGSPALGNGDGDAPLSPLLLMYLARSCSPSAPEIPPPLCDFVVWIDKEMDEFHSGMIRQWREWKEERDERQRQRAAREKANREREKEEHADDQERKLARVQRAKDAGSEAGKEGQVPPEVMEGQRLTKWS
uniref:Uncharacterized protein n=1 Tax=Oryza punctata TaxID=4537 RepID=A0A0E0JM32_ORYPU